MPNENVITQEGSVITQPRVDLSLGNWGSIVGLSGATVAAPANQTGPASTIVLGLCLMPLNTGIFLVSMKASYSDGTTAGALIARLITKQGAGTGQIAGGIGAAKFGSNAAGLGAGVSATFVGSNGQVLNADAAGGGGLTFEGSALAATGVTQSEDKQATLTGLLTANGTGVNNFQFQGPCDALGPTGLAKTPFTLGRPVFFGLQINDTAAHVVTFDSVSLFV